MMRLLIIPVLFIGGCCARETVMTPMVEIPMPPKPTLTNDNDRDVKILGKHTITLRKLIHAHNVQAQNHNGKITSR